MSHQRGKAHSETPNVIRLNNGINELVAQQQDQAAALQIVEPQEQVQPRNSHQCEYYPESYPTKSGLGLHIKSKHPDQYNDRIKVAKNQKISLEEVKLIASAEARAIIDALDIYVHLQNEFPERRA